MNTKNPFITRLQQAIALVTIFAAALQSLLSWPMTALLSLNALSFQNFFIWQPLTSLFFLPEFDFAVWPFVDMVFVVMLFGLLANQAIGMLGRRGYITLFLCSTLISSIAALLTTACTGFTEPLSMLYPLLLAHATLWAMAGSAKNGALWMLFPLSSKWLLIIALAGTVGKNLFTAHFELAAAYLASFLFIYSTAVMWLQLSSPFIKLWPFEAMLRRQSFAISRFWNWKIMAPIRRWQNKTTVIK